MRNWWLIYAATAVVCLLIIFTVGNSDDSRAIHVSAVILILGLVILWRLSER